jgi:hypothetical protein
MTTDPRTHATPSPREADAGSEAEQCDHCGSLELVWRKCKLVCNSCRQIVKSCADL